MTLFVILMSFLRKSWDVFKPLPALKKESGNNSVRLM